MVPTGNPASGESFDVERLFDLAREKSQAGRAALYQNLWDIFEQRNPDMNADERDLMLDLLRRISRHVELSVRKKLAERLAGRNDVPRELVVMLANDESDVAFPILVHSRVLKNIDLIEVIRHRMQQHRLAIAMRRDLEEEVSRELVQTDDHAVIVALLENRSAKVGKELIERLVEESRHVSEIQAPLLRRPELPKALAERMYHWVSAALRTYIVENFQIDEDDIDDHVDWAASTAFESDGAISEAPTAASQTIDTLQAEGELNPRLLVEALRKGQIELFETGFGRLTGLSPLMVRRIAYEPGGEALAIACKALGLDRRTFMTLFNLTRHAQGQPRPESDDPGYVRKLYEGIEGADANRVLRKWLRNPRYLSALKDLGVER